MTQPSGQSSLDAARAAHRAGVGELQRGRVDVALPSLQRAVAIAPQVGEFQHDLGSALAMLGRHEDALECFGRAIGMMPGNAWLRCDAGMSLMAMDRVEEAVEELGLAAELSPNDPRVLVNFGMAMSRLRMYERAAGAFERAAQLATGHPVPWTRLAEALWSQGKFDEALPAAKRAVELAPNDPPALVAFGNIMQMTARFDEAAELYRRAATLDPGLYDAHNNLALTLLKKGEARAALELCDQVIARWPDRVEARVNRALVLLTLGDYGRGFGEYEQRSGLTWFAECVDQRLPRWDGSDPSGRTIVITNEQGMGDMIQFVRYASLLAERGATVRVACAPELAPVVRTVSGVSEVIAPGEAPAEGELGVSMSSLPAIFKTTLDTVPADVPYVHADPARLERWRERFAGDAKLKVGVVWAGGSGNDNDRARSCALAEFAPLASVEHVTLYSLQKGPPASQLSDPPAGMRLIDLGRDLADFGDTAAVIECLDLTISVDTSVAHLAGAMGKPVWTILYKGADWRWLIDREDSPWYPTMRLFRQTTLGDWKPVVQRVAVELRKRVKETM